MAVEGLKKADSSNYQPKLGFEMVFSRGGALLRTSIDKLGKHLHVEARLENPHKLAQCNMRYVHIWYVVRSERQPHLADSMSSKEGGIS